MSDAPPRSRKAAMIDRKPEAVPASTPQTNAELIAARARIAELETQVADLQRAISALRR